MVRKPLPSASAIKMPVFAAPPVDPLEKWNIIRANKLSAPLPPIPWVCQQMRLAPGPITLVSGYGYSGKTMAMQSLGLSVAAGKSAFGVWNVRQGPFVHLDYEQGLRLNQDRYQRLARGMGFELQDLPDDMLRVACMPHVYLDEAKIFDDVCKLVEGAVFVLVDSLRAAFPKVDENDSKVRAYLDMLSRVSERTGACIAVIHHARKPSALAAGTATHAMRGSGSIFDAGQTHYHLDGDKDAPTIVHHQKDRITGSTLEDFGLTREDVPGSTGPRHGLRVMHLEPEQIEQAATSKATAKEDAAVERVCEKIIATIGSRGFHGSRMSLRGVVSAKTATFDTAMAKLTADGWLSRMGTKTDPIWTLGMGQRSPVTHRSPSDHPSSKVIDHPSPPPFREGDDSHGAGDVDRSPKLLDDETNLFGGRNSNVAE